MRLLPIFFSTTLLITLTASGQSIAKEFDNYHYLSENKTETEHYQIKKLNIQSPNIGVIYYDPVTTNYIVETDPTDKRVLWKINSKGDVLDSIEGYYHVGKQGVFFRDNYYIDWVMTNDKTQKKYKQIIDYNELTDTQFLDYLAKAEAYFINKSTSLGGRCYLKIDGEWLLIKSQKLADDLELKVTNYELNEAHYLWKGKSFDLAKRELFLQHKMEPVRIEDRGNQSTSTLLLKKFTKKSQIRRGFLDLNSVSRSGWNGIGFFELVFRKEIFRFKSYAFKSQIEGKYDVSFHMSHKKHHNKDGFIFLYQHRSSMFKDRGLYVLMKK